MATGYLGLFATSGRWGGAVLKGTAPYGGWKGSRAAVVVAAWLGGRRRVPVAFEQAVDPGIRDFAVHDAILAERAFADESEFRSLYFGLFTEVRAQLKARSA